MGVSLIQGSLKEEIVFILLLCTSGTKKEKEKKNQLRKIIDFDYG